MCNSYLSISCIFFNDTTHDSDLSQLNEEEHIYSRLSNPTIDVLEKRIAALEGDTASVAVSSEQSSQSLAIQNIASSGV